MAEQRLIDANALLRDIEAYLALKPGMVGTMFEYFQLLALDCVETAPTVEAKPVVHAHWVSKDTMEKYPYAKNHYCSNCKVDVIECGNFCTNCGAQMDEKENDNAP